jgi:hypothetical protein
VLSDAWRSPLTHVFLGCLQAAAPTCFSTISESIRANFTRLRLHRRGCRVGQQVRYVRYHRPPGMGPVMSSTLAWTATTQNVAGIPGIIGNRSVSSSARVTDDDRSRCFVLMQRQAIQRSSMIGMFNAQSVANKSASILAWISHQKLTIVGLTATWHDATDRPSLIACAPPSYTTTSRRLVPVMSLRRSQHTLTMAVFVYCSTTVYELGKYSYQPLVRLSLWRSCSEIGLQCSYCLHLSPKFTVSLGCFLHRSLRPI